MCAGNSRGLILPSITSETELRNLRESLPNIKISRVEESLSALGIVIACNDYVALVHPEISKLTEDIIIETLNVPVFRTTIANHSLVGSYCYLTNKGGLVHPKCSI